MLINFFCFCLVAFGVLISESGAQSSHEQVVVIDLLNKLSAKKHRIKVPLGSAYLIQDIRIVPRSCKIHDTRTCYSKIDVFLEQEEDDKIVHSMMPILLYSAELSTNIRKPKAPLEHPIYDLILVSCE